MAKKAATRDKLKGNVRLRSEIVEAMRSLHSVGLVSDAALEKATLQMLGHTERSKFKTPSCRRTGTKIRTGKFKTISMRCGKTRFGVNFQVLENTQEKSWLGN